MAASWWKYGLCVFGGLGVGYAVGVKITKDRAEKEKEQEIADIREIYRNDRKAKAPKKQESNSVSEQPEIQTKTSIQMEKLSKKKDKAMQAANKYSKTFDDEHKPGLEEEPDDEELDEEKKDWKDYIHLVDEFPDDSSYREDTLKYYADGVLAYESPGGRVADEDIPHLIGEDNLRLLERDECNMIKIQNELYHINYTVIFCYESWAEVVEEEPYKELL